MKFTQEISIFNPRAIEFAVTSLGTQITQTAAEIRLEAQQTLSNYYTKVDMNSIISQTAQNITLSVSETYATISEVTGAVGSLSARIDMNASNISAEVTDRANAIANEASARATADSNEAEARRGSVNNLSARIDVNASAIETKVAKGSIISTINQSAESVTIDASKINLTGYVTISSLGASGTTTVNGSRIHGGTLTLGGASNGNGQLEVYDADNNRTGFWNNGGLRVQDSDLTLRTTLTDGTWTVYKNAATKPSETWQQIGSAGTFSLNEKTTFGIKAIPANCAGFTLCIGDVPYYGINTSDAAHGGIDFTGYGFRHYFKGDVYCDSVYKTSNGYGWFGEDWGDPWVVTGANVQVGEEGSFGFLRVLHSIEAYGTVTSAYGTCQGSDSRLKTDICTIDLDESKNTVLSLRPVQYRYKEDCDRLRHGFIAQEVQEITDWDPVVEDMDGKYLTLSYEDLIADLVNVIQDQEKRLSRLEGEHA